MRKYRDKIDPQLRHIARKIPFTEKILRMAEKPQTLMLKATPVPRELFVSTYKIQGYNNLEFPIEVYESAEDTRKKPCLFYIHGGRLQSCISRLPQAPGISVSGCGEGCVGGV